MKQIRLVLQPGEFVLAIAANTRYIGAAILAGDIPVYWHIASLGCARTSSRRPEATVSRFIAELRRRFRPRVLILFTDDGTTSHRHRVREVFSNVVEPEVAKLDTILVRVSRSHVAQHLKLFRGTNPRIRQAMFREYSYLAQARSGPLRNLDLQRYWETAALATAAAQASFEER